jgi:KTSC domain
MRIVVNVHAGAEDAVKRERMDSTSVASVGYDASARVLEVEFRNGGVYQYLDVPGEEYDDFREADSKGAFLNTAIKPNHRYRRVRRPS